MRETERSFQEFVDAIWTAQDEDAFERIANRWAQRLGFRWFAYLSMTHDGPVLISSYPKLWTRRYFRLEYQKLDPIVRRARREHSLFSWAGGAPAVSGTLEQRRFFDEAMTFGIKSGITVPIRGGFGQMAAFTIASDDENRSHRLTDESADLVQLAGLYFHAYLTARKAISRAHAISDVTLAQRERQCLAWIARGKTVADTAVLVGIAPRTVTFHLENARRKLGASSIAHCVAEALRRRLLPD